MKKSIILTTLFCAMCGIVSAQQNQVVKISGTVDFIKETDTIQLFVFKKNMPIVHPCNLISRKIVVKNQHFNLQIDSLKSPTYINIRFSNMPEQNQNFLISPNTDVNLTFKNGGLQISGLGSVDLSAQYEARMFERTLPFPHLRLNKMRIYLEMMDQRAKSTIAHLNSLKSKFSPLVFDILLNDQKAEVTGDFYYDLATHFPRDEKEKQTYIWHYKDFEKNSFISSIQLKQNVGGLATEGFYYRKYLWDSCALKNQHYNAKQFLKYLIASTKGEQQAKAVIADLYRKPESYGDIGEELGQAIASTKSIELRTILIQFKTEKTDGAKAYDFSLTDINGKSVHLSDFQGSTVVLDFWFTGCHACRLLSPTMKALETKFVGQNVKFIGISIDTNIDSWQKSVASGQYVSPDIVNLMTNGKGNREPMLDRYKVVSYPTIFVITKDGKLLNVPVSPLEDEGHSLTELITANL